MIQTLPDSVAQNDLITAENLLKQGQNVNTKDAAGFTPLMIATGLGNVQMVELLLTAGADPTMVDTRMGATALHKAAQSGVVDVARLLVKYGAFLDAQAPTLGNTPLIDAVWHKRPAMVHYLLEQGARIEIRNRSDRTARDFAIADLERGTPEAAEILNLLDERQAHDRRVIESQQLMTAVLRKDLPEVRRLIAARVPLDEKAPLTTDRDWAGYTPLLVACLKEGCGDIVRELLQAGANPRLVDEMIRATPGHKAGYQGHADTVRELVKDGRFEIDAQGPYNGYTALHDAIWHGHVEAAEMLIEAGARLDLRTHTGHTPLLLAISYGYSEIASNILKKLAANEAKSASHVQSCRIVVQTAFAESGERPLGITIVGLGEYSNTQLRPALKRTKNCRLAGIVTGTPTKAEDWSREFGIPESNIYNYDTFDRIAHNEDIDIVYVVLPNALHAEFTIRALKAGKHVICEKPMAPTVEECQKMIEAAQRADRTLSIGYRLHFDPFNLEMKRLGRNHIYGKIKLIHSSKGIQIQDANAWRLKKCLAGGGALMDVGVYAIHGARYILGEEPITVLAQEFKADADKFREVEETICWQLEFPSGAIAYSAASYAASIDHFFVAAEHGSFELNPAYGYPPLKGRVYPRVNDLTHSGTMNFANINQQAAQLDAIAEAIRKKQPSPAPGEEGLQDLKIIEAIYKSAKGKQKIAI